MKINWRKNVQKAIRTMHNIHLTLDLNENLEKDLTKSSYISFANHVQITRQLSLCDITH